MPVRRIHQDRGFSLIELLVAMVITVVLLGAALTMFKKSADAVSIVAQRAEMQANARVAINSIVRDLTRAGSGGVPFGGISLPAGSTPFFAKDINGISYMANNTFQQGVLYVVTPGFNDGPTINGIVTDGVTMIFVDPTLDWRAFSTTTINNSGTLVTMPAGTAPALNDPVLGVKAGDLMMLKNIHGTAVGEVTQDANATSITFADADSLSVNHSTAASGNIKSLADPPPAVAGTYPATTLYRILMVSYFIQPLDANGNPLALGAAGITDFRLMRQVNAHPPVPIAEHIALMKFSYDLSDSNTGLDTSNVSDATIPNPGVPPPATVPAYNEIRNVYITVTARSTRADSSKNFSYATMYTNLSPRSLSFQDTYQ
jgi:prepilin-type N-terminal cleavage/methylation domain-containing protein